MRTFLITALFAATAGLASCASVAQTQTESITRQISVSGLGEAKVDADMALVHLTAQSQRMTSEEAKRDVDQLVNEVIQVLDEIGLDADSLTAGQLSISPRYNYRNTSLGNTQEFAGYFASRAIQVEIPDLDLLNPFLDAAVARKIDGVGQIEYRTSEEEEAKALARELAIQDSKDKAEYLARAYGVDLGAVISISYQSNTPSPILYQETSFLRSASPADSSGQYIPDQLSFTDNISVTFELKAD